MSGFVTWQKVINAGSYSYKKGGQMTKLKITKTLVTYNHTTDAASY